MFAKSITLAIAGTALLGTVAFAQTPTTTSDHANGAVISESSLKGAKSPGDHHGLCHRFGQPGESLVSGSRGVQCDQG